MIDLTQTEQPVSRVYNIDCMAGMKEIPDRFFHLAICDPPYGGQNRMNFRYNDAGRNVYENIRPEQEYWDELFRVSKNQIVWGGNYFTDYLPVNRCWISWYKGQPIDSFSDFELAWTSFDRTSRGVKIECYGFNHPDGTTIHPTQKPIKLYAWLLSRFAEKGDKILDTHLGGGSHRIAAYKMGFDFWAFEKDKEYFDSSNARFNKECYGILQSIQTHITQQLTLF